MADDKKKPTALATNVPEEVTFLLAGLVLLGIVASRIMAYLNSADSAVAHTFWDRLVAWFLLVFWPVWKVVAVVIIVLCVLWMIFTYFRLEEVVGKEEKVFGKEPDDAFREDAPIKEPENERWQRVFEHGNSNNPADWRLAIIEADIMLEEALRSLGYMGAGVGDMLKSVDPSDMTTLDNAWEAHKVRNRIAHSGQDFELTERETRRVLALFESVFREFNLV